MNPMSFFENVFAWLMIAVGVAILFGVRWRPTRLWDHPRRAKGKRLTARRDANLGESLEPLEDVSKPTGRAATPTPR